MSRYGPAVCIVRAVGGLAALPAALVPMAAFATDYMNAAEAQRLMFPQATAFAPLPVGLTPEQGSQLASRLGKPVSTSFWKITSAMAGDKLLGYVVTDNVIGKAELISYAVGLTAAGEILDVQILAYREDHGGEVRTKAWRQQFVGKSAAAPLRVGDDIANISGATLSCTHLTEGIRRIAAYAQLAFAKA